jgi:hypothetical protein
MTTDKFKGYERLLPSPDYEGYDAFYKAKKIYDYLVSKKGGNMTMSKFTKLANIKGMSNT